MRNASVVWLNGLLGLVATAGVGLAQPAPRTPEERGPPVAVIAVEGLGWWDSRRMRLTLERLLGEALGPTLRANAVEDAVFLLMAALAEDGYLRPLVTVNLTLQDGRELSVEFDHELRALLPRPLFVTRMELRVVEGVRYVLDEVRIDGGGDAISPEAARLYFGFAQGILVGASDRLYHPSRARASAGRLEDELRRQGFAEASVTQSVDAIDHSTGKVTLTVEIVPRERWVVGRIVHPPELPDGVSWPVLDSEEGQAWHSGWEQDTAQAVRQAYHEAGYPDVRVAVGSEPGESAAGQRRVTVRLNVAAGERVRVGQVRFEGAERTKRSVLARRTGAKAGTWLNPQAWEQARYRLGRLGVFRRVDLEYQPVGPGDRDVIFHLREQPPWEASLLLGYGSYEQLRGGVEVIQTNLWGRAHRTRLHAVQSLKGTRGDYAYTVPELFGEQLDGTARVFALRREEIAFLREEYGGGLTLRRPLPWIGAEGRAGYTFQSLQNADNELTTRNIDDVRTTVASLDLALTRDQRDNPLRPRRGYRWFSQAELASTTLGGEVEYQRFELGGSYHTAFGRGRWIHAGFVHGVVLTLGTEDDTSLPVNRRFYPGGESSLRGFQDGEAAPRGADGAYIGAKSYMLFNLELEQALTKTWSAVVFFDALGQAARLADYPFDERLYTVGAGVRYQTLIGPVRLEYGHNLNPRPDDPSGTLHLSVGFPF